MAGVLWRPVGNREMNILVIPSWYPSQKHPLGGIFCREQAEALATCSDCRIIVADWGQNDGALPLSHPLDLLQALWWRAGARRQIRPRNERFFEVFEPTLIWSPKLPGGGNVTINPRRDLAIIAVQGPNAQAKVWTALPGSEAASSHLKYFQARSLHLRLLKQTEDYNEPSSRAVHSGPCMPVSLAELQEVSSDKGLSY